MVHGQNGSPDDWGSDNAPSSMFATLKELPVARDRFGYGNRASEWVTDEKIGPKLAARINCLIQKSLDGGGNGKVIILAHSMGGLAAQYAVNQTVNGHKLADYTDVITIGTPYDGSYLADLCEELEKVKVKPAQCQGASVLALQPGSKELAALPPFPPQVKVHTIAGNVTLNTVIIPNPAMPLPTIPAYVRVPLNSDIVVQTGSATKRATSTGGGDGARIFACEGWIPIPSHSDAPCEHNNLLKMPEVQQEVKGTIEQYIASAGKPAPPVGEKTTLFDKLSFIYPTTWDSAMGTEFVKNFVDQTQCSGDTASCPHVYIVDSANDAESANYDGDPIKWLGCPAGSEPRLVETIMVDGEPVEYYEAEGCDNGKSYLWYAKERGVFIAASDVDSMLSVDTLKAVVANIEWL
jgi:hypothetical protein